MTRPPTLPPTALDEPPLRPPERPPKKANLRSHFSGQIESLPHISNINEEKPGRPYYYRRPPAPDPPVSPEESPSTTRPISPTSFDTDVNSGECRVDDVTHQLSTSQFSLKTFNNSVNMPPCHAPLQNMGRDIIVPPLSPTIQALAAQSSRSSTPDLPPPPPPLPAIEPENTNPIDEQPLPPPPCEISRLDSKSTSESIPKSRIELSGYQKSKCYSKTLEHNSLSETFINSRNKSPPPPPTPSSPPPPLDDPLPEAGEKRENDG